MKTSGRFLLPCSRNHKQKMIYVKTNFSTCEKWHLKDPMFVSFDIHFTTLCKEICNGYITLVADHVK